MSKNKKSGGKPFIKRPKVALRNQTRMLTGVVRFNGRILSSLTTNSCLRYIAFIKESMFAGPFTYYDSKLAVLLVGSFKTVFPRGKLIELDVNATDNVSLANSSPDIIGEDKINEQEIGAE